MSPSVCVSTAIKGDISDRVEQALRAGSAMGRGQGQAQVQRPVAVRRPAAALVHRPRHRHRAQVLLMDEPCSALDPIATRRIEELMLELKEHYTIAIVTHNMQQAMRVADTTAFFSVDISEGSRTGYLVEIGETPQIFGHPREKLTRDYISGQFS